jgi:hypothetical protein
LPSPPGTRFVANEPNDAWWPSAESETPSLGPFACAPFVATLNKAFVPLARVHRNTSTVPFESPATIVDAAES